MNIFYFLYLVFFLSYLSQLFSNQKFYYTAEMLVFVVGLYALRRDKPAFPLKPLLVYFVFSAIIFVIGSGYFDAMSVMTGFRYLFIPLMLFYIGRKYYASVSVEALDKFLKTLVYLSVPAGILGELVNMGYFKIFGRAGGDSFGGIFGPQGGSGILGMFITIIMVYFVVRHSILKERVKHIYLIITVFVFLILIAEAKIALVMFVFLVGISTLIINMKLKQIIRVILISGVVFIAFFSLYQLFFPQFDKNIFTKDYFNHYFSIEKLGEGIFAPEARGREVKEENEVYEATRLTRIGAAAFTVVMLSRNWKLLLFGFGPGTAQFSRLYQSAIDKMGFKFYRLDFFAGPAILFEYGLVGLTLLLIILSYYIVRLAKALREWRRIDIKKRNLLLLVLLFAITVGVSLVYNNSFFLITFGGLFWFLLGVTTKNRDGVHSW